MSEAGVAASPWQDSTVVAIRDETKTARTFRLHLSRPAQLLAGQHYIVRLTAPDGYTAQRSYSVASPPEEMPTIELTVERLPGGEVSVFLHESVMVGDELEVRGPIGRWFVWDGSTPALLIGGGSGVVPLMAMLRQARRLERSHLLRLVVSVRSPADLYYPEEISGPETTVVYTREAPPDWERPPARLRAEDLIPALREDVMVYICGSARFADAATDLAMDIGIPAERIRIERFGPTG